MRVLLASTALVLGISCASPQEPPGQAEHGDTIRTHTQLVLVPLVVTDSSGTPVTGLAKDAFAVEENGRPRTLALFEESKPTKQLPSQADAPAGEYRNFPQRDELSHIIIVVIDSINTPLLHQGQAKQMLADSLRRMTQGEVPIGLFSLTSTGLQQLHPFTADTKALNLALERLTASTNLKDWADPLDGPWVNQRTVIRQTLSAMTQFARALGTSPGRKTIIWITAGFPFAFDDPTSIWQNGDDLGMEYEKAWRSLNSANIAIYPFDFASAEPSSESLPSSQATISDEQLDAMTGDSGPRSPYNFRYDVGVQQRLTMHVVANVTGGRSCGAISEFDKCFAQALQDSGAYYLLGYYLEKDAKPGWRKLHAKVSGKGLQIRSRSGFYVAPLTSQSADLRHQELVDALASVVQYAGVQLTVRRLSAETNSPSQSQSAAEKPTASAQTSRADFELGISGDSITILRDKGNAIEIQLTKLAFNSEGKCVSTFSNTLTTHLSPEMLQEVLRAGLVIPQGIDLPVGDYEIRFAVRDNPTGKIGTVSIPLQLK